MIFKTLKDIAVLLLGITLMLILLYMLVSWPTVRTAIADMQAAKDLMPFVSH